MWGVILQNSMSFPRALCLSLSKCANGLISPHRVCTINELYATRFGWHRNCHSLLASSLKFIICISFWRFPVFKLVSTRALSSVHSQQLPHCKKKNTQHDQTFNYILFFCNKKRILPPQKSNLRRGIHIIFKNDTQDLNDVCKNPDRRITINKSTCWKKASFIM